MVVSGALVVVACVGTVGFGCPEAIGGDALLDEAVIAEAMAVDSEAEAAALEAATVDAEAVAADSTGELVDMSTAGRTAEEANVLTQYAQRTNAWLDEVGPKTVQSTAGNLRSGLMPLRAPSV